jgi:hypothetical protein
MTVQGEVAKGSAGTVAIGTLVINSIQSLDTDHTMSAGERQVSVPANQ